MQNNGKVAPRTFQPTGFLLLRHAFNCSHHRRRMGCHLAPISQERSFSSVVFFCHATSTSYNVESDLSRVSSFCGVKPNTSLATVAAASAVRPGSTCQLTAGSCDAGCSFFFQRKRWFWPLCAFKYALTSFWQLFCDTNI